VCAPSQYTGWSVDREVYQAVGYYFTRECASGGILWCRRTPLSVQATDQSKH